MQRSIAIAFGAALIGLATIPLASADTGMTKQQARYAAEAAGYSQVSHLKSDGNGGWMGAGSKGAFDVTPTGKVVPR